MRRQYNIVLEPGDAVLLLTDGIPETDNGTGELFGMTRVVELVQAHSASPARETAESLYDAARSFANHRPQTDDMTAILLKVQRPQSDAPKACTP